MSQTTIRIDDDLLARVKAFAALHRRSMNSVVEDALREALNRWRSSGRQRVELPVFSGESGYQPWVDPSKDIKHIADEVETQELLEEHRRDVAP